MELRVRFQGHSASDSFRFVIFNFVGLQLTRDLLHFNVTFDQGDNSLYMYLKKIYFLLKISEMHRKKS